MLRHLLVLACLGALTACSSAVASMPSAPSPSDTENAATTNSVEIDVQVDVEATVESTVVTSTAPAATEPTVEATTDPTQPVEPPSAIGVADPPLVPVWQEDGPETQRAQERLLTLGFWLAEANGEYGQTTTQAVMAFQKYAGITADGKLGPQTAEALSATVERASGRSNAGSLVEVDKSLQLLFIIRDGTTDWVLNTSTGSEVRYREPDQNSEGEFIEDDSITRTGLFAVDRERAEGWWEGDLGEIYRPKYFDGGIALHGSYNIPPYPASHGCVRLSIQAMDWIWEQELVPMGTTVWVHGEIPSRDV